MIKHKARRRNLITFTAILAVMVAFLWWLLSLSGGAPRPGQESYHASAVLPDAGAQLVEGARVTMSGVQVGTVTDVERRGAGAVIGMKLTEQDVTPLPADTKAQLRSRTPLGENYITLTPGRARQKLPEGGTIPLVQAQETIDVDQVLSTLQGRGREDVRRLIKGVGSSLAGRGEQLNVLVGSAADFLNNGTSLVNRIHGQRAQIARLVDNLGAVAAGIGERGDDLRSIGEDGVTTFRAIAAQDDDLRALAKLLPGTLSQVRETTGKLARTTDQAAPVLSNLAVTVDDARPAARRLGPAADELRGVIGQLGAVSDPLGETLRTLRRASGPAATALPELRKTLCQISPMIRYAAPYASDIVGVLTGLGSSSNAYDAIGHTIRLGATLNKASLVGLPPEQQNAVNVLTKAGAVAISNRLTYDPYPKPNSANKLAKHLPQIDGPQALRESGWKYPRVTADC
jgi:virulence factor Mce-like protein